MKPRVTVGTATSPDGTLLELIEHNGDFMIKADGLPLMNTRMHHSEEELARLSCRDLQAGARVLVGGLGIGYTLRTALDLLPEDGQAVQVELVSEIVEWNRGPLAEFAQRPLDDPRTELVCADVTEYLREGRSGFSAIMLDVDNGPSAVVDEKNDWLYSDPGLQTLWRVLVPGGRLAIWSADDDRGFPARLRLHGFEAESHVVHARPGRVGPRHMIFVGSKPGGRT
jgi:spermidine synthase